MSKANNDSVDKSLPSNLIKITDQSKTISKISYIDNSLVISKGQHASTPPKISKSGHVFSIKLQAGRHGTQEVASTFNNVAGGNKHEYAPDGGGGSIPDKLNFFFAVSVEFKTELGTATAILYLGQGHYLTVNNWWIGGKSVRNDEKKPCIQVKEGGTLFEFKLSGSHESLNIHPLSIATPIKHVFVLMLENHSFDNVLAMSGIPGIRGATTSDSNIYDEKTYYVHSPAPDSMAKDPGHNFDDVVRELAGQDAAFTKGKSYPKVNNSGFAYEYGKKFGKSSDDKTGDIMACFDTANQLPVIYQLAANFTICDQWFSSLPGPTWPNRYFIHGASSNGLDDSPSKSEIYEWESVKGFSYPNGSIYDAMDEEKISWRLYIDDKSLLSPFGGIPQVASIKGISFFTVHNLDGFEKDLKSGYKHQYTFIEPNYGDVSTTYRGGSSQHPLDTMHGGEKLIKKVYEAIRNSPVWDSSLLIITYDEHGGFYDSCPPGKAVQPNDGSSTKLNKHGFKFDQLGVRVPAVIVSPWVAATVDHTEYDHTSVLATVEKMFGMKPLTDRDANAKNLLNLLLPNIRTDTPKKLNEPAAAVEKPALTSEQLAELEQQPLPDSGNELGFLAIMLKTELELSPESESEQAAILEAFKKVKTVGDAKAYLKSVMEKIAKSGR